MKKSTKAALLSAFIFPGAGHLYLKRYLMGTVLLVATVIALFGLVSQITDKAFQIVEQLQLQGMPLDLMALTTLVSEQLSAAETQSLNITTVVIVVCWIVGILDSVRIGHAMDRA